MQSMITITNRSQSHRNYSKSYVISFQFRSNSISIPFQFHFNSTPIPLQFHSNFISISLQFHFNSYLQHGFSEINRSIHLHLLRHHHTFHNTVLLPSRKMHFLKANKPLVQRTRHRGKCLLEPLNLVHHLLIAICLRPYMLQWTDLHMPLVQPHLRTHSEISVVSEGSKKRRQTIENIKLSFDI